MLLEIGVSIFRKKAPQGTVHRKTMPLKIGGSIVRKQRAPQGTAHRNTMLLERRGRFPVEILILTSLPLGGNIANTDKSTIVTE